MPQPTTNPWLHDDSPLSHKIMRVVLFLTSFSWTFNPIQDYMGESTPVEKIVTRMVPLSMVAVYCLMSKHRRELIGMVQPRMWTLLWYICVGVMCGMSSVQPALCVWKGAELLITLMWICTSCRDADSSRKELSAFISYLEVLMWVTVFLAIIRPSAGLRPSSSIIPWIQGYLPILNPNTIGFVSVIALTRVIFLPVKYKAMRVALLSGTLLCAQSRTSYIVMMAALAVFIVDGLRHKKIGRAVAAMAATLGFLCLAAGWMDQIVRIFMRGESIEEMSSLSGRTDYWGFAIEHISWFGDGLATGSRSLIFLDSDPFSHGSVNMHNSFIEALIGAGYIGAIPFLITFVWRELRMFWQALRSGDASNAIYAVCALVFAARAMTSIVLAIFSLDHVLMIFCWAWIWKGGSIPKYSAAVPKPRVYEKTLAEQGENSA